MLKTLIRTTIISFLLTQKATAMAPAVSCQFDICPWLEGITASQSEVNHLEDSANLVLKKFPSDGIEQFMPVARHEDTGIPETVEGLWWMDFKQEGDILVTFATSNWNADTRTALIPVYGERTYSFKATEVAAKSYAPLLATRYTYKVEFNEDFTKADITPILTVLGHRVAVPRTIAHFRMHQVGDGHWIRESWVLGFRLPDYDLLRIVQSDLTRDAAYEDYLKVAGRESYLAVPAE